MTALPIVERELRVAARNPMTYRMRASIASVTTVMFVFFAFVSGTLSPHQTGQILFHLSFGILFLGCLLGGSQLTADVISNEKREGTLGFLFLTDLKGYDIVLGKLAANSLWALYGMLSLLPLISIIFLFGGVSGGAMVRMSLACLNVLFLSLAVGLVVSCLSREMNKARGAALFLMMVLIVLGPIMGFVWTKISGGSIAARTSDYWMPFLMTSPLTPFGAGTDLIHMRYPSLFWMANGATLIEGVAFLALACWLAPRTWQERAASRRGFFWQQWWRNLIYGSGPSMLALRQRLLDINAVYWLTSRQRFQVPAVWVFLVILTATWMGLMSLGRGHWFDERAIFPLCVMINAALRVGVAMEAAKHIVNARESGALELLLCTSLPVSEIFRGQWLSIQRIFLRPMIAACLLEALLLFFLILYKPSLLNVEFIGVALACLIILWADYLVLPWVGMWQAIASKKPKNAGMEAAGLILGQPWVITYLFGIGLSLAAAYFKLRLEIEVILGFMWFSSSLFIDWWWYRRSRMLLEREFRLLAMSRYAPPESLTVWGRVGRFLGRHLWGPKRPK